jgi:hypothetical protein
MGIGPVSVPLARDDSGAEAGHRLPAFFDTVLKCSGFRNIYPHPTLTTYVVKPHTEDEPMTTHTDDVDRDGNVTKARHFGSDDDDAYAKLVVTDELLEDDEMATRVLDSLRDSIAAEVDR